MVFHRSSPTSFNASGESEVLLHAGTATPRQNAMLDTAYDMLSRLGEVGFSVRNLRSVIDSIRPQELA
jgi:hypothetical protein